MSREALCRRLGYSFVNEGLLDQALRHRSAGSANNERQEFLGDAVLNLVIAEVLFSRFPGMSEGNLTRIRASLVKGDTLASIAKELDLGPSLELGSGELKSGGRQRNSILADALEAVFGAIYQEGGFETCKEVILRVYETRIAQLQDDSAGKDPKTRLQEWLQAHRRALPVYDVVSVTGQAHRQHFTVSCQLPGSGLHVQGEGSSRRKAEQEAAGFALQQLVESDG